MFAALTWCKPGSDQSCLPYEKLPTASAMVRGRFCEEALGVAICPEQFFGYLDLALTRWQGSEWPSRSIRREMTPLRPGPFVRGVRRYTGTGDR